METVGLNFSSFETLNRCDIFRSLEFSLLIAALRILFLGNMIENTTIQYASWPYWRKNRPEHVVPIFAIGTNQISNDILQGVITMDPISSQLPSSLNKKKGSQVKWNHCSSITMRPSSRPKCTSYFTLPRCEPVTSRTRMSMWPKCVLHRSIIQLTHMRVFGAEVTRKLRGAPRGSRIGLFRVKLLETHGPQASSTISQLECVTLTRANVSKECVSTLPEVRLAFPQGLGSILVGEKPFRKTSRVYSPGIL